MSGGKRQDSKRSTSPRRDAEQQAYEALIGALTQWTATAREALDAVHDALDELHGFSSTRARVACAAVHLILDAYHEFCRERNMIANISGSALNPQAVTAHQPLFPLD